MRKVISIKRYILVWVCGLAVSMSLLLSYQSSQFFLKSFEMMHAKQMHESAELLPKGKKAAKLQFNYHVASGWEQVPKEIKSKFPTPPETPGELLRHFENWWYFAPPETGYFLMFQPNKKGENRYISKIIRHTDDDIQLHKERTDFFIDPMVKIALWGLGALAIFILLIYRVFRNLAAPIAALYDWAQNLTLETVEREVPDFHYMELNALSGIIHHRLEDVAQVLEREKEFLSYASHELRTPIAALRSNATLLDKVSPEPTNKEREVRDRILRASLTMKGITETLLWLGRESDELAPYADLDIEEIVCQAMTDLDYLLTSKQISMQIDTEKSIKQLPEAAFRILVANVVRNAFQHTLSGTIEIKQTGSYLRVKNSIIPGDKTANSGFGLGLKLIRKIVDRFGWEMIEERTEHLNDVLIKF